MRHTLCVVVLFAGVAACSTGSQPATLIPPGPSDPGGPGQDGIGSGSTTTSPATTSVTIGAGGAGGAGTTTTTITADCVPDTMPCGTTSAPCCTGICSSANVCVPTCPSGVCVPGGGVCCFDSDCCPDAPNCTIGICTT